MVSRSRQTMAKPLFFTLLACFSTATTALNTMTYKGCFSSSTPLVDAGYQQYQTSGLCQQTCVGKSNAVLGLSGGSDCWCGDQIPAASSKVDDSKCSTPCNGYGQDNCGGTNFWSVYLTGTTNDVSNYGGDSDSSSSSATATAQSQTPVAAVSSATASPSVVTSVSPGNTVVVTISASASSTPTNNNSSSGSSSNTAGIAAGVVVGVVGAAALIGGVFFFLRRRRRQQAEDDYKRSAQVSDFMRSTGDRKAPNTGYSQMSDSRLDPEIGRRNSVGSMADEQDYSRRILRVANPDSH